MHVGIKQAPRFVELSGFQASGDGEMRMVSRTYPMSNARERSNVINDAPPEWCDDFLLHWVDVDRPPIRKMSDAIVVQHEAPLSGHTGRDTFAYVTLALSRKVSEEERDVRNGMPTSERTYPSCNVPFISIHQRTQRCMRFNDEEEPGKGAIRLERGSSGGFGLGHRLKARSIHEFPMSLTPPFGNSSANTVGKYSMRAYLSYGTP